MYVCACVKLPSGNVDTAQEVQVHVFIASACLYSGCTLVHIESFDLPKQCAGMSTLLHFNVLQSCD